MVVSRTPLQEGRRGPVLQRRTKHFCVGCNRRRPSAMDHPALANPGLEPTRFKVILPAKVSHPNYSVLANAVDEAENGRQFTDTCVTDVIKKMNKMICRQPFSFNCCEQTSVFQRPHQRDQCISRRQAIYSNAMRGWVC